MTFGAALGFGLLYNKLRSIEKNTEPQKQSAPSRVDFDLSYAAPKGRAAGVFFFILFCLTTITFFFTRHYFYALVSGFAALCALLWPFLKQIETQRGQTS
jgi:hypothetical protein